MVRLGDTGDRATNANPVGAHHDRVRDPRLVGVGGAERAGVSGAELEDVANLNAVLDAEIAATGDTGIPHLR